MKNIYLVILHVLLTTFGLTVNNALLADRTIVFGGDYNYPPYEYIDDRGEPAGFNVDLTKAIAKELGWDYRIVLGPSDYIERRLNSGQIDILMGTYFSIDKIESLYFSRAHSNIPMAVVYRKGDRRIAEERDIYGKEIIIERGKIIPEYSSRLDHALSVINVNAAEEALALLVNEVHDIAILNRMQSAYLIRQNDIRNLSILPVQLFTQEYCFAALHEKRELIDQIDHALVTLVRDGTVRQLNKRWFTHFVLDRPSRMAVIRQLSTVFLPLLGILFLIFSWTILLRAKAADRSEDLTKAIESHKITAGKLAETRKKFQNLAENHIELIFETDTDGVIMFANRNIRTLFQYTFKEAQKIMRINELFIPTQRKQINQLLNKTLIKKEQVVADLTGLKKDGTTFPVRLIANALTKQKEAIGVLGTIIDLSYQRKTELIQNALFSISEAAHQAKNIEELFSLIHKITASLMNADNFYIAIYDEEEKILKYPYNVNALEWAPLQKNPAPELTEYVFRTGKELLADAQTIYHLQQESAIDPIDKPAKIWLGIPLKISSYVIGVIAVQDYEHEGTYDEQEKQVLTFISEQIALAIERKRFQEKLQNTLAVLEDRVKDRTAELKRSEELFRTLAENSIDIIMRFDRDLRFLYVNPTIEKKTGIKAEDCINKKIPELDLPADLIKLWDKAITTVFETGESHRIEFVLSNGIWIDWHLVPEFSNKGTVTNVLTTAHDITDRKISEEEINKLNAELEQRVIDRTKQLEEEIQYRKQTEKIQHTLYIISEAINKTRDIQELYKNIHSAIKDLMPAKNFSIALYDEMVDIVNFPYNVDEFDETPSPHKARKGLTEYVLRKGTALLAKEKEIDKLIDKGEINLIGRRSKVWLGIPLKMKDRIAGVMTVQDYDSEDTYTENDKQILTFVSEQIALAIERKEAEYQTDLQRIYFEHLFNNNPAGIVMLDTKDRVLACNDSFVEIFGYSQDELIYQKINPFIVPESLMEEADKFSSSTQAGQIEEKETVRKTKDGKDVYVKIFGVPVVIDGRQVGIYGIYLDISELHNALNSFFEEKEKLIVMLSSIGDGVIATDTKGNIILLNKVAEDLTGWTLEEAENINIDEVYNIVNEANRNLSENLVSMVLRAEKTVHLTNNTILISKTGKEFVIENSAAPIKDRDGKLIGIIVVFRDITERKIIEEELQKSAKLESIGILAGGIAHDFNNILTAILGNVTLARNMIAHTNHKANERLLEAEKASVRAKDLTHQLLTFSRGGDPIKKTASIREIIHESSAFAIHGSIVDCKYFIAEDLMNVEADLGQISQVISNLVINSVQAMPNGGVINIRAENTVMENEAIHNIKPGKYVKITIEDCGVGIPRSQLSKIFDPFYTTKKNGTGLGLTTSHNIIKKHDGYLIVDSSIGEGTIFSVYLPASDKKVSDSKEDKLNEISGKGEVLLMDDDLVLIEVVSEMLLSLGYNVTTANEGKTAVQKYKDRKELGRSYDLVILDLTIPGGMGGKDTIKELIEYDPEAVCIVSSGYSSDPVMSQYEAHGFKAVLTKPYSLQQLGDTLKSILG